MKSKPAGLGPTYSAQFNDPSVVAAYGARPPYPDRLIRLLLDVAAAERPRVLDLGCGTGELARRLAPHAASVTAVDRSWRMIAQARALSGGSATNVEWVVGAVEDVALSDEFTLALSAESFHWFDWARVCRRLGRLVPSGRLILVEGRMERDCPWADALASLIARYSTNRDYQPYNLVAELESRSCFVVEGQARVGPEPFRQSVDDYIRSIHSRNGFSRDRMLKAEMRQFDRAVAELVSAHAHERHLELHIETHVTWGRVPVFA